MGKRVAVVGTRFTALQSNKWAKRIEQFLDALPPDTEVLTGGAAGTDRAVADYAAARGLKVTTLIPEGPDSDDPRYFVHSDRTIVELADELHAFWDGESAGTHHAIQAAKHLKVPVHIHFVHDEDWEVLR